MNNFFEKNIFVGKRPYFIIIALAFLIYLPALFFGFTYLDDNNLILDHAGFISNITNIFEAFRQDVFLSLTDAYYRPMLTVSFILDAQLGDTHPFMYHFTNVLIHLLASCLVFLFLKKLSYRKDLSFLFALIFAVHPVLVQAVAWIPGRNDSLLAVFILAAFINFLNYLKQKDKKCLSRYFLFFALAIFTKESAIMLVPVQLFYYFLIYNSKIRFKDKLKSRIIKLSAVGWAGILGLFLSMRHFAFQNPISFGLSDAFRSVFGNSLAFIQYIGKIIFPFNLSAYPIIQDTTLIYGILALIIVSFAIVAIKQKRYAYLTFGIFWFFLFLTPSFVRPNAEVISDFIEHRLYLPIIGFFILILEIPSVQKFNFNKKLFITISVFILLLFSVISMIHSFNFKDRLSFWENAANHSPHAPLAHRNLGAMLYLDGKMDEAEPEFKKALELNPQEQMAHNNLGLIYMNRGDFQKAEQEFDEELKVNPYYDSAYANKGLLYFKMERYEEAVDFWKKTLEINPVYSQVLYNLFAYYYQKQDKDQSVYWATEAQKRGMPLLPEMQRLLNPFGIAK